MPMTAPADLTGPSHPARSRRWAPTSRSLWSHQLRLFPTPVFLALAALGGAWAVGSRLDAPIERTELGLLCTLGLSVVLVDAAAATTASSVVSLARRRLAPATIGIGLAFATWALAWALARALASGPSPAVPMPGAADLLEWSTITGSQLAVGAVATRRRPTAMSFGPGLLVALAWFVAVKVPRLHAWLFDPVDHQWRWVTLLAASVAVAAVASIDPAHRFARAHRFDPTHRFCREARP